MTINAISIIIPVLNEERIIGSQLGYLSETFPDAQVIVVDGHSSDRTVEIASQTSHCVLSSRGRGVQMNIGAEVADGDLLWFLHADCTPDAASVNAIKAAMSNDRVVGGAFRFRFDDQSWPYSAISRFSNLKNHFMNRIYGDMGIFVRRSVFRRMGGFSESMLMEDIDFSRRLRICGKVAILKPKIVTSSRDWVKEGIWGKLLKDSFIKWAYRFGTESKTLYEWYYREAR